MSNSALPSILALFPSFQSGDRLVDGGELQALVSMLFGVHTGITAHAGGGQSSATPLRLGLNRVDTCASDSDSILMPPAIPGSILMIYNNTAHTLAVFGQPVNAGGAATGDTLAASTSNLQQPTATGITQATALVAIYVCFIAGQWKQYLSA